MENAVDGQQSNLLAQAQQIADDFEIGSEHIQQVTRHFVKQMRDGLANHRVWQLLAYVRAVPNGSEKGEFLAVDLGGSNCRICLVQLHGDSTFTVTQNKHSVPPGVMVNRSYTPLFDFIAERISEFFNTHLDICCTPATDGTAKYQYKLGFTFSFTCEQTSLASGRLLHWDKGWDIPDAIGRDPCSMLQEAIDRFGLPIQVTVLANDSVGTLLTRSYCSGQRSSTLGAIILGTGTNAAYVERMSNIGKLSMPANEDDVMVINTEWGCFDDKMEVLPSTTFDDELNEASTDRGSQMLEKRVSGLYLGELLRLVILRLLRAGAFNMKVDVESPLFRRDGIDSSFLSQLALAGTQDINNTIKLIQDTLSALDVSGSDAQAVHLLANSIARRAARLAGASLAAMIIQSGRLQATPKGSKGPNPSPGKQYQGRTRFNRSIGGIGRFRYHLTLLCHRLLSLVGMGSLIRKSSSQMPSQYTPNQSESYAEEDIIDIGADGSLIELYPTFEEDMRRAMREVPQIGHAGEQRVRIGLAKDGSGVGAALMAQVASQTEMESLMGGQ
ncbi:hypothetical protein AOCH_000189 [Aspergillus ochraceoroseus]|uniref:Phosphotransferase n=1 Tax=Aspergillus ochraceoroseus TaxID=138278 RepID=A0A0F8WWM5_9EURO|nr:hypothetical protein AOCH_000189 [Aspergillus ochraceoroseus]